MTDAKAVASQDTAKTTGSRPVAIDFSLATGRQASVTGVCIRSFGSRSYLIDKLRGTGCGACVDLSTDSKHCGACSSNGCHDASGRPGVGPGGGSTSLDLAAGNALQSLLATTTPCGPVLVPGDPGSSVLPKGNGSLTTQEIDLIATWVCQGAAGN